MVNKSELVKELRNRTQAGMKDCINALDATNNDIEAAINWLRENGTIKAAKKASAIAAEGVCLAEVKGNKAAVIEVNCQTDFVAKNENFLKFSDECLNTVISQASNCDEIPSLKINGVNIQDAGQELTATIGEKIAFRRGNILNADQNQTLGCYTHMNKKIAVIVKIDGNVSQEVAKDVCMHAAALNPKFANTSLVDPEWLKTEKQLLIDQTIAEGKKPEFAEKIVEGRVEKLLKEVCLENQNFVKDPSLTVLKFIENNGGKGIIDIIRLEVGEGIEKKVDNFAEEVAAQMKQN